MNIHYLTKIALPGIMLFAITASIAKESPLTDQITISQGRVVISGAVPDEATKTAILTRLQEVYGTAQVVDQIIVGGVAAPPNWSNNVSKLITDQLKSVSKGQILIEGTTVSLRGEVPSETIRKSIANDFAAALNPTYVVKNGLRVTAADQALLDQTLANRVVEFEQGSALLTDSGKVILDEMAETLKKVGAKKIEVIGHTDNVGVPARNLALSRARAGSVKTYLVAKGIPSERIDTSGMGSDQPVASNVNEDGRRRNRRIEFRISQ